MNESSYYTVASPHARAAAEHGYELVVAEDLCSGASIDMHAFSFMPILPRLARITSSGAISLQ
jgi:hypothetical protein